MREGDRGWSGGMREDGIFLKLFFIIMYTI